MKIDKKILEKSQIELNVILSVEEFEPFLQKGADKISKELKIDGFRAGKVPMEILKQKIGEMAIYEESSRIAINKTIEDIIKKNIEEQIIGQPKIDIIKLAPNNPFEYKIILAILPKIKINNYKNLKLKKAEIIIDEKEIDKTIQRLQESSAEEKIVDRKINQGDKVIVDINMFQDKVAVDGGQSKNTAIFIGKNLIVPGFDKNLIGAKKNNVLKFSLIYPKEHYMKNLAGKNVDFEVTIKEVYERNLSEIDDVYATKIGAKNLNDLKKLLKENIKLEKEKEDNQKLEKTMLEKIIEQTKFDEIPEMLINHEVKTMIAELEQSITQQGGKMDDYLTSINKTMNQLTLDILPDALKRVKVSLLLREIAEIEKIKISDEEIKQNIQQMKKAYKDKKDIVEKVDSPDYKTYISNVLVSRKVIEKLKEWNVEK